jgi:hypothetical protein
MLYSGIYNPCGLNGQHGVVFHKIAFFISAAVENLKSYVIYEVSITDISRLF